MGIAAHRFDNAKRRRPDNHARQAMLTPAYVLEPVRALLAGIDLDPCTEPDNPTRARQYYCLPQDGCALQWNAETVWCNPPYGEARDRWVDRCIEEGRRRKVVLLIPAHTETKTFQRALNACTSVLLIRARLRFGVLRENGRQEAASHGSALFGFGVDLFSLNHLGVCLSKSQTTIRAALLVNQWRATNAEIYADTNNAPFDGAEVRADCADELEAILKSPAPPTQPAGDKGG